MIGGEFKGHGSQQKATMKVASNTFPAWKISRTLASWKSGTTL
jgi:hypothetical protein